METEPYSIYVDEDDTADSICAKSGLGWRFGFYNRFMSFRPRTGHYIVEPGVRSLELFRKLRNGAQDPIKLTVPSVRTLSRLAAYLGNQLECEFGGDRCFGVLANMDFILISTYGPDGADPELVLYKKR